MKDGTTLNENCIHTPHLVDSDGINVMPEIDKEWFGGLEGNEAAKEAVLDKIMADMIADGAEPDRAFQAKLMNLYTVCSYDEDRISVRFAPLTWDIDKAGEIQNLMVYGVDPSVDLPYMSHIVDDIHIINKDDDVYEDRFNNNWVKEIVDNRQDFTDAVADIPVEDNQVTL